VDVDYSRQAPVVEGRLTVAEIETLIAKPMDEKPNRKFYIALSITGTLFFGVLFAYA